MGIVPLSLRKGVCILMGRQKWLDGNVRYWWTMELLKDFAEKNRNGYHRFLWTNHLAYAASYEVSKRFGEENIVGSRRMFFSDLAKHLSNREIDPQRDIHSVFEVGCSLGYQLRYLETDLFPSAIALEGIDIDSYAIERGKEYLEKIGSKIQLICEDMKNLDRLLEGKNYDIIVGTGVLMYLQEKEATMVVENMLRRCRIMVALSGLAHPNIDNSQIERSVIRERDGSFIHNIDSMVKKSGGNIFARRWEGNHIVDGHTIYFVFATKNTSN